MNIFYRLRNLKNLTDNEKVIVSYLLEHPQDFINQNPKETVKACFVSLSTLYRLCNKLELTGVSQLKVMMSKEMDEYLLDKQELDYDYPIHAYHTSHEVMLNLKEVYEHTVVASNHALDEKELYKAVDLFQKAKSIDIYTSAGNIYFAQNFMFQMAEIGKTVQVPMEEYHQRLVAASSDSSHVAIVISYGGRGSFIKRIVSTLKDNHTPIIFITSLENPLIEDYGDIKLYMSMLENHYHKISSFSTRLSLLYILDCLYTCYFKLNYEENKKKKINYYKTMSDH